MLVDNSTASSPDEPVLLGEGNPLLATLFAPNESLDNSLWMPLLLFGESGSGKSFVALSLANRWTNDDPTDQPVVATGADLARLFQPTHLADELKATTRTYRNACLLVVDDIHLLANRDNACSWLLAVMDHRVQRGLPMIFTAPSAMALQQLPKMIVSRLLAGLPVSLSVPDLATRRSIISKLWQAIHSESIDEPQLAEWVKRSDGLSFAAIENLVRSSQTSEAPSATEHRDEMSQELPARCMTATAKRFGIRVSDLKGPLRRKNIVLARSVAMFLIREFTSLSLVDTGRLFQDRDHTTVRHACQKIQNLLLDNDHVRDAVQSICASLNLRYDPRWSIPANDRCA